MTNRDYVIYIVDMKMRVQYIKKPYKDKVYSYPFLVSSYRDENGKPQKKIIEKLSHLPEHAVEALRLALRHGENSHLVSADSIVYNNSIPFGDVWSAWTLLNQIGIIKSLKILPDKHQSPIIASIIDRVVNPKPDSKRALFDAFESSVLKRIVNQEDTTCLTDWYKALDSLYHHQMTIQKDLFCSDTAMIYLYDITSTYFEGSCCPLSTWGYDRDGKKGKMIIVIGMMTDSKGRPLAIRVFKGSTSDQTTVLDQIKELKEEFGIHEMVFVGDRGMITSKRISELEEDEYSWVKYITALKRKDMMDFVEEDTHPIQLSLFDHKNLVEVSHEGRRYVLCHNPLRKAEDQETRLRLLSKTEEKLHSIANNVQAGRLKKKDKIARRLYRWINKWNMERFFSVKYDEGFFEFSRKQEEVKRYSVLDGCYVVTSNIEEQKMTTSEIHQKYKDLKYVENAFRSMKVSDINLRPVRHWSTTRVKGHVFMCMLAYLVIWETRKRLAPLLERDPDTRECEGKSLFEIWKKVHGITIGSIRIEEHDYEQFSSRTSEQKRILKLLRVTINNKTREKVGMKKHPKIAQS
ncbi:IS1634 family transposase [candidate division CSSED10-310 bacterium]|uniref:IS1634 family transposase n=1 Tax=candidate division CSSED10-310 bacterium TaxID=2855610 RepID=A0ABV6Z0H7_UNCC1